jgi:hypothetical protein
VGLIGMRSWGSVWERESEKGLSWLLDEGTDGHCLHELWSYFYGRTSTAMAYRRNTFVRQMISLG